MENKAIFQGHIYKVHEILSDKWYKIEIAIDTFDTDDKPIQLNMTALYDYAKTLFADPRLKVGAEVCGRLCFQSKKYTKANGEEAWFTNLNVVSLRFREELPAAKINTIANPDTQPVRRDKDPANGVYGNPKPVITEQDVANAAELAGDDLPF